MTRRRAGPLLAALALLSPCAALVGLSALSGCAAPRWDRNVVLVVIDTLRADGLPLRGGRNSSAPFLDEVARHGLVFDEVWSASSWTAPATASIFTSTYPNEHGVLMGLRAYGHHEGQAEDIRLNRIPAALETIPLFMQGQGYRTFGVSGNPNIGAAIGFTRGFDRFAVADYKDARELVSALLGWRDEIVQAGRPFFLYLHFMDPHGPYHRHAEFVPPGAPPPPRRPLADRIGYDSEIHLVDAQIQRLFRELPLDASLLIVTSDHGQEFFEHGALGHGFQLYSELTRVPLLLRLPGGPSGRVSRAVSNMDVLPTLRALLGAPPSPQDRGRPLLGPGALVQAEPRDFFSMRSRMREVETASKHAVVRGELKLIVTQPGGRAELYDLASDPREQTDIAAQRPADVAALRELLDQQRDSTDPSRYEASDPVHADADMLELLRRLGYVDDDDAAP